MLVKIEDVEIVTLNADDPEDYDEFVVTGGLRINDQNTDAQAGEGLDNECPVGTPFASITGTLGYSFENYKLEPRSPADVQSSTCSPFHDE